MALRAVLFDLGDTLIRLDAAAGSLVVRAAATLDAEVDPEAAGLVWERVVARASSRDELAKGRDLSPQQHREVWTELYRASGADALVPSLAEAIYAATVDARSWVAFPDTLAVLDALRSAGVALGAVSDTGFDLRPVLERAGIAAYLDAVVFSCEHGACKPDPGIFASACERLGTAPEQTLMVGDNPYCDGGAALAGLPTLVLPPPQPGDRGLDLVLRLLGVPARSAG